MTERRKSNSATPANNARTTVVILAGSSGSRLFPLTINTPKCLLPVGNTPCLALLLASLATNGFRDAIVVTVEDFREHLSSFFANYSGPVNVNLVVNPDDVGTSSAICALYRDGLVRSGSVMVIPGECIIESQIHDMLDKHQKDDADLTMLLVQELPNVAEKGKKTSKTTKRDEEDIDVVALLQNDRIAFKTPLVAVEEELLVPKTIFARSALTNNGNTTRVRSNLTDIGVYVLSNWVLQLLDIDEKFSSLHHDLVPYLIRRQFHSQDEPGMSKIASLRSAESLEVCRCFAFIVDRADPKRLSKISVFSHRSNTISSYLDINRLAVMWPTAQAPWGDALTGTRLGQTNLIGHDVIGGESPKSINASIIGSGCQIGAGTKINNSVIMSGVTIAPGCLIQDSIVGAGCSIGERCKLMACQVGNGHDISADTTAKNESFGEHNAQDDDDEEDWN